MNCTVFSQDNFLCTGIKSLYSSLEQWVHFESVIFIDVMSVPDLESTDDGLINTADLLVFIVDSSSSCRLLKENIFVKLNRKISVQYICRAALSYEFEDLLKCDVRNIDNKIDERSGFNAKELSLISHISTGQAIYECMEYRSMNKKTLSSWKRNIMRKLNVTTDAKLYDIIMKCSDINKKLSALCY